MKPYILGHRGAPTLAVENSLLSFEKIAKMGVEGAELDIHLTADNKVVVIHDENIKRLTEKDEYIKNMKYSELCQYSLKDKFSNTARIPLLTEVLSELKDCKLINIEIKNYIIDYPDLEKKAVKIVKNMNLSGKVIFSSFNHYSIKKLENVDSKIETGVLYYSNLFEPWEYAKSLNVNTVHPHYYSVDKNLIDYCHKEGLQVFVFGVDNENKIKKLINLGVDGIITDFPKKALKFRDG